MTHLIAQFDYRGILKLSLATSVGDTKWAWSVDACGSSVYNIHVPVLFLPSQTLSQHQEDSLQLLCPARSFSCVSWWSVVPT